MRVLLWTENVGFSYNCPYGRPAVFCWEWKYFYLGFLCLVSLFMAAHHNWHQWNSNSLWFSGWGYINKPPNGHGNVNLSQHSLALPAPHQLPMVPLLICLVTPHLPQHTYCNWNPHHWYLPTQIAKTISTSPNHWFYNTALPTPISVKPLSPPIGLSTHQNPGTLIYEQHLTHWFSKADQFILLVSNAEAPGSLEETHTTGWWKALSF